MGGQAGKQVTAEMMSRVINCYIVDNHHSYREPLPLVTVEVGVGGYSGESSLLQRTVTAGHCGGRSGWLQWRILTVTGLSIITGLDYWNGLLEWTTGMDYWTSHRFLSTRGAVMLEKIKNYESGTKISTPKGLHF